MQFPRAEPCPIGRQMAMKLAIGRETLRWPSYNTKPWSPMSECVRENLRNAYLITRLVSFVKYVDKIICKLRIMQKYAHKKCLGHADVCSGGGRCALWPPRF